jgi:C-terminal processing protease CtpA/Prc
MKYRATAAALMAATLALAVPAVLPAQVELRVERGDRADRGGGGWMGILFDWDEDDAQVAHVREVVEGSPAARAGIREGDVVVRVDGRPATGEAVDDLRERLREGGQVRLRVRRDGREEEKVVTAGRRPDDLAVTRRQPYRVEMGPGERTMVFRVDSLGVHMDSLRQRMDSLRVRLRGQEGDVLRFRGGDSTIIIMRDSILRSMGREPFAIRGRMPQIERIERFEGVTPFSMEFGPRAIAGAEFAEMNRDLGRYFRTEKGLLVLQVAPSTPAARAGLEGGDVVVKANGETVETVTDLRRAVSRDEDGRVRLEVIRQGRRRELDVRWERGATFERTTVPGVERRFERSGAPGGQVRIYRRERGN